MGENISWYLKDQVAVIKGQGEMDRTCDLGAGVKTAGAPATMYTRSLLRTASHPLQNFILWRH